MKQLKHIRRIFESTSPITVTGVDGKKVTLINPDGKHVTIEVEEDGNYSEYIDSYTKEISVSGEDGTYNYGMTAMTDDHDTYFEIMTEYDIEVETLDELKKQKERSIESNRKWQVKNQIRLDNEERERNDIVKKSGLSALDYASEERLEQSISSDYYKKLNSDIDKDETFRLAKIYRQYFDEDGKFDDYETFYLKVPFFNTSGIVDDDIFSFISGETSDTIQTQLTKLGIFKKYDKLDSIISPHDIDDPRKYMERAPFYFDVSSLNIDI